MAAWPRRTRSAFRAGQAAVWANIGSAAAPPKAARCCLVTYASPAPSHVNPASACQGYAMARELQVYSALIALLRVLRASTNRWFALAAQQW